MFSTDFIFRQQENLVDNQKFQAGVISSGQRNLMKTYHNEANTGGITKIASKILEINYF